MGGGRLGFGLKEREMGLEEKLTNLSLLEKNRWRPYLQFSFGIFWLLVDFGPKSEDVCCD